MNDSQELELRRAIDVFESHCRVEYDNYWRQKLAKDWLSDLIVAIRYNKPLPPRPAALTERAT